MIERAVRSLMLPPGLNHSALPNTRKCEAANMRSSATSGVLPTVETTLAS
jgi:hypothetical protein